MLAGLLELVPVLGTAVGFLPALLIAMTVSPLTSMLTTLFYILVFVVESRFLAKHLIKPSVKLHPVTAILAIMIGAIIWGVIGIVIVLPLVVAGKVILEILYLRKDDYANLLKQWERE